MRLLISIIMFFGASLVVLIGLLSVLHDLLIRTAPHIPECEHRDPVDDKSTNHPAVSEDFQ